ncbi:hypothetical protein M413DRAFT_27335 [Hebeloma cylindrosporum]|uniref:Uncharacterized protein n=1 Tax=Hebeloma cylindrosporum TaxID=76867 RepID=A0A0C3BYT5_HEBCY|nr:hypothetical protein M413DRAFT_27335 [Hebeloma cylindrosporum h7]
MCLFVPRISLRLVPLVDWVKSLARAALAAIAECIADAGHLAFETFLPGEEVKTLAATKAIGSCHAAVLRSVLVGGVDDGLNLVKSHAIGLYKYVSSTVARWKWTVKDTCLWILRRVVFVAAKPFVFLRAAASRVVTSRRGVRPALWKSHAEFFWKDLSLLVARVDAHTRRLATRSVRRLIVTLVIFAWVLYDLPLFNVQCHGVSPYGSSPLVSSSVPLRQVTFKDDALTGEDTLVFFDDFELPKPALEAIGCQWASGFCWADDIDEEEAKRGEVVYLFPPKAPVCQILYAIQEEFEDEVEEEEEFLYFEELEEKTEQASGNESDENTLCDIDPLVSGILLEEEEEFAVHETEPASDVVKKEQRDFEITLVVASNVTDLVLFEGDNAVNVKLPVSSSSRSILKYKAPVFVQEQDLVTTTWARDLCFHSELVP